jgi:Tol biopolymer transport system component
MEPLLPIRAYVLVGLALVTVASCNGGGDGLTPEKLQPDNPAVPAYGYPIWSPDGRTIGFNHRPLERLYLDSLSGLYVYQFNDSLGGFWLINSDGSNMRRVLPEYLGGARWSPDGRWIAYESNGQVWKVRVEGDSLDPSSAVQATNDPNGARTPDWSPDGNRLVYVVAGGARAGLWISTSDGIGTRRVGASGWTHPDWHPWGHKFLFTGQVGPAYGLGECDTLGLQTVALGLQGDYAEWSPTGQSIAFLLRQAASNLYYNLCTADSIGQSVRQLTTDGAGSGLSWSPDGTELVYVRFAPTQHFNQNGTLWIIDVGTGTRRQLSFNPP